MQLQTIYPETVESLETQYEQERGKPLPSKNHSIIQGNICFELRNQYGQRFDIFPELSLELAKDGKGDIVPDICIYDKTPRDWNKDVITTTVPPLLAIEILK